jgi:hypothetical protein
VTDIMSLLMITGHQRSGTTILRILLNSHPEIAITNEFANLKYLGRSRVVYSLYILRQAFRMPSRGGTSTFHRNELTSWRENVLFIVKYLALIQRTPSRYIGFLGAGTALHSLFPARKWVGDKFPDYIWSLKYFALQDKLTCIVIYRDARDVVSSSLESSRSDWKDKEFVRAFDTAEKVASRWVKSVELMEQCAGKILPVRYERLISEPRAVMEELGRSLGVDPAYFPIHILHGSSIGKYRDRLSKQDLATVETIAGETLVRVGYQ